jgi:hypothetical protein
MTTSGTYAFAPSLGQITLYAFQLIGIRPTALLQEHLESAHMAANLVLADWSNKGPNLWQINLTTVPLVQGTATYGVPANVVNILDLYVTVGSGSTAVNRYILPISRTEYASYANINQQGFPSTYWNDRLLSPTVTFWPVPDGNEVSFSYYALQQMQDANFANGQNADLPYLWLAAFANALAVELATIWAPDKLTIVQPRADRTYAAAAATGTEIAQMYISPQISSYFR